MAQNWWEAAPVVRPGGPPRGGFIYTPPPDPTKAAQEQRAERADARAAAADARAAAAARREQIRFDKENADTQTPGDTNLTGEAYLATIPKPLAAQVRALAEGRRPFPNNASMRSQAMQELVAAATQYDPTLDAANSVTRVATRKDFTSGKAAQNITAINTALGHLGTLWTAAQGLKNRSFVPWNTLANATETTFGDPRVKNFGIARDAVANELMKVFRNTGGSLAEIEDWKQTIGSSDSPEQLRAEIGKAVELLNSRLQSLGAQYNQGLSRSDEPISLLTPHSQAVFSALQEGGSGILPDEKGGPPALGGGGSRPPGGPRSPADYSAMVGKDATLASGDPNNVLAAAYKKVPDNEAEATLAAFIRHGRPYDTVAAYARSHGFDPPPAEDYAKAVAYQKSHPDSTPNVDAFRNVQMSFGEKAAASPAAAALSGALSAGSAGFNDLAGHLIGGDAYDANRQALSDLHPTASMWGNVAGGIGGTLAFPGALARIPGGTAALTKVTGRLGNFAPVAGDAAYGTIYGANTNPDDPLIGGATGGLAGVAGGMAGRGATRGLANIIAPPAGEFGPAYAQGAFPTLGQRFARSGLAGRIINTAEQAMQSMPGLGSLVTRSRDIARDQAQVGAFNQGLNELAPFDTVLQRRISALPEGMGPGTEPHAFAKQAFDDAYDTARSGMQFAPDQPYIADHQAFSQTLNNGVLSAPQAQQVQQVINTAVGSRLPRQGGGLNGDAYKAASKDLGTAIDKWGRNPDTAAMADALRDYQTVFDNAARRNSSPDAVNLLDAADRGYAKYVRVRNAANRVGGDAGTFTMKALNRGVQQEAGGVKSGPFLRGDALMQDYATAVQPFGDTLSNSGTGERLLTNKIMLGAQGGVGAAGLGTGAGSALLAHPLSLAPFAAYAPGVDRAIKLAIAPREYTLPPIFAQPLVGAGQQIRGMAPFVGRVAAPAAIGWELQQ